MNPTQLPHDTDFEGVARRLALQLADAQMQIAILFDQVQQSQAAQATPPDSTEAPTPGVV